MLPPNPGGVFNTAEYRSNWGLNAVNPIPAYEASAQTTSITPQVSGAGTTVAIIDTGFNPDHPDMAGVYSAASVDLFGRPDGFSGVDDHGGFSAGIIAANKNDEGIHGIAFDATILGIRADDPDSCPADCTVDTTRLVQGIDLAIAEGVDVISISLGGPFASLSFTNALRRAADAGIFIVISAGNESNNEPSGLAQAANASGVRTHMLIVGSIDDNANFSGFSNRAGADSRNNYVVAPGENVRATNKTVGFSLISGTSFAAPHVAGAAALLKSVFPNLEGDAILTLLTTTATDFGNEGIDNTFGHGLINIGNALQAQGTTVFVASIPGTEELVEIPIEDSGTGFSLAFGDSFFQMDALDNVMMLDGFQRSYFVDATARLRPLYPSSLSLADSLEGRRLTQALYMPVSGSEVVSFSYYDPHRFVRDIAYALSPAVESTLQQEMPATYFDAQLSKDWSLSTAFGFSPGDVMDRHSGESYNGAGFLAADFDSAMHLGITQDPKTTAVKKNFKKKASVMFGAMIGSYDYGDLAFIGATENAKAFATFVRAQKATGRFNFNVTAGILQEENAILGSLSTGALQLGTGATTTFTGVQGEAYLGKGYSFFAQYNSGWTNVDGAHGSLISNISSFRTSSFTAAFMKTGVFSALDRIGIAVHQPLRVENGQVGLYIPTARDYAVDRILFSQSIAPIAPSGRQIDIELSYRMFMLSGMHFEANFVQQFNPGHTTEFGDGQALLFRLSQSY